MLLHPALELNETALVAQHGGIQPDLVDGIRVLGVIQEGFPAVIVQRRQEQDNRTIALDCHQP